jgi:hypothetical protein
VPVSFKIPRSVHSAKSLRNVASRYFRVGRNRHVPLTQRGYGPRLPKFDNDRVDHIFHLKIVGSQLDAEHEVKYQKQGFSHPEVLC